jgi:hypothetical protein
MAKREVPFSGNLCAQKFPSSPQKLRKNLKKKSLLGKVSSVALMKFAMGSAAFALAGAMVIPASSQAFSGWTGNDSNTWTAGTVALTDNRASASFAATGVVPGYSENHCITVTSESDIATVLSFYASQTSNVNNLADNLIVKVETGAGATDTAVSCAGFVSSEVLHDGTMTALSTAHGTAGTAVDIAAPLAANGSQQFRITASLPSNAPNSLQGGAAGMDFNWINRNP